MHLSAALSKPSLENPPSASIPERQQDEGVLSKLLPLDSQICLKASKQASKH